MLSSFLLLFVALLVAATVQGYLYGRMGKNRRERASIPRLSMYQFGIKFGWDNTWMFVWAGCGVVLVTAFWAVTFGQVGWVYEDLLYHYRVGPVPLTLTIAVVPGILYCANWRAQYWQLDWRSALIEMMGVLIISVCLGVLAWPLITLLWFPWLLITHGWETVLTHRTLRLG